ncbi:MAG: glycosyltransferase family 2 protein [Synergistaceae bacterium]|nr:glycosyltransferase family 2 protein [Synergistaceae bacterium]
MEKLVSVIVPTYNGEKFIAQTLGAIINQDYENIEIIVVDDVSTDNTVEVAKKTLECSGRKFQLIRRTVNGHQSASRNTGLDASNGDYVIFFDHDDLAEKNFVSSLLREAENKNADFVFCGFREYFKTEDRYNNDTSEIFPKENISDPEKFLKVWVNDEIKLWSIWNFIFRKSFLTANNLKFPEDCYIFEDVEFVLKAITLTEQIHFIRDVLYTHIYHPAQQSKADLENRINYKNFRQEAIVKWRAGRRILRITKDKKIRNFIFIVYIAQVLVKECTLYARAGDKEGYDKLVRTLHHKKIRQMMYLTLTYIKKEPELFFKSLMLLYTPNFYYKLRCKKQK